MINNIIDHLNKFIKIRVKLDILKNTFTIKYY